MKREMPWIGQSPELISGKHHKGLGKARILYDFYVHRQTDVQGRVYYGKPLKYRWISQQIHAKCLLPGPRCGCPSPRTLERYNRQLRENGYVQTKTVIRDGEAIGFSVTILNQTKFNSRPVAQQIGLFNAPVQIPVQNQRDVIRQVSADLRTGVVKTAGVKAFKKETGVAAGNEQTPRAAHASSRGVENVAQNTFGAGKAWRQQQKAKRLLQEIERIREVYVGAYGDDLVRRDLRLKLLYEDLERTGWQNARAG